MIPVLGLPLERAVELLSRDGFTVETRLVRCRKDTGNGAMRVVRQTLLDERTVRLTYALFRSSPDEQ